MSLTDTIDNLKGIADDAKQLFEVLKSAAEQGKEATHAQKDRLKKLTSGLDENVRKASRERRQEEINQLNEAIAKLDTVLSIVGLPKDIRDDARAERARKVARRGRLRAQQGLDFSGILNSREIEELQILVDKANKDVARKKQAAAFLQTTLEVADIGLRIAAKLAV